MESGYPCSLRFTHAESYRVIHFFSIKCADSAAWLPAPGSCHCHFPSHILGQGCRRVMLLVSRVTQESYWGPMAMAPRAGNDQALLGTRCQALLGIRCIIDHVPAQTLECCELTAGSCGGGNLFLDLGANVETDILCQICEWVLELRVCAGLTRGLLKLAVLSKIISVLASRTRDPMQWGQQGHPQCSLHLRWTLPCFLTPATITLRKC